MTRPSALRAATPARLALILLLCGAPWSVSAQAQAQAAATPDVLLEVRRFEVSGANPLGEVETDSVLAPHLGAHRGLATLEAAAGALESQLRERGYSFHRVIVPAQKPVDGVVRLQVLQFPLATVEVIGNAHFSEDNIRRSLPGLQAGTTPDVRAVSRDLGLANEHSSKRLSIVLKESVKADALDAEVRVRDVPPTQFFVSLTGATWDAYDAINRSTGYTRLTVGYQNTNLFDLDHALTLTYTTSPDHYDRVQQLGAFYWIPFYGKATSLQLYYTRSDVNTGSIGLGNTSFNVNGTGEFMGARLTHSLAKTGELTHNISLAIDDRYFQSNIGLAGLPLPPAPVRSRPLSLRYAARWEQPWGGVAGHAEEVWNLGSGSRNTDADYIATRAGASRSWDAFRYGLDSSVLWRGWNLTGRLRGQFTNKELIPGEQFGLGGVASVRGLREREFAGDVGYAATLEALGPPLTGTLRPVGFFDFGSARLLGSSAVAGTITRESAASIGVGLRWNLERRMDVSVDLAYVLNGTASTATVQGTAAGDSKLSFALFYRF